MLKGNIIKCVLSCAALLVNAAIATAQPGNLKVSGKVVDETGQPLIGAGVIAGNSGNGVVTDLDGNYSISLGKSEQTLSFSYVGYETQQILVDGRKVIDVQLKPDETNSLNEIVVIGYGTTKKEDLTGSVAVVKMTDIEDTPSTSIDQALQGKIAGVDVMSTSGEPGAGTSIRIRGSRSIEASNEPLIVVDGVIDAVADLNEINPDDIESISVLKDASSTAIYGSRGANGVVIITTKKGVTAKPRVVAKVTFGVSRLARKLDLMNADELLRYRNDCAFFNSWQYAPTENPPTARFDIDDYKNDTNWIDIITRTAFTTTANVSVSGSSNGTTYFASGSFNDTQGIIDGSGFKRATGRFNVTKDFTKWLSVSLKANYTFAREDPNKANIGGTNVNNGALYLAPYIGAYDDDNPLYENGKKISTPRVCIDMIDYRKVRNNASFSGEVSITPIPHLVITSQNTYTPHSIHVYKYSPSTLPSRYEGQLGQALRREYNSNQLMSENTVTYSARFAKINHFKAMVGFSASRKTAEQMETTADGVIDDNLKWYNLNAISSKEGYTVRSSYEEVVRESVYARVNYDYNKIYYFTLTVRGDGSSNFAANNKWGFFPSGAFKWNAKNEKFLAKVKWLDNLAVRLSAGRTGNDAITAYNSLGVYSSSTSGAVFDGTQSAAFYPDRVPNPDLTWEKTTLFDAGVDFSAFKERLSLTFDAYYSYTTDLLLSLQTMLSTGFSNRMTNLGRTSNRGFELTLDSRNIVRKKFEWDTEFSISHNRQMVEDIGHEEYVSVMDSGGYMMYGYKSGYPLNSLWGFQYCGVFHTMEEVEKNNITHTYCNEKNIGTNPALLLGRPKYADVDHNGELSKEDLIYLGSSDPVVYGGFQNSFTIGDFKLGVYLAYSFGGKIYNYSELYMSGGNKTNQYRYMTDCFHPVRNPYSDIPRAGLNDQNMPSSFQVHDASYIRLKTVNASYTFHFKKSFVKTLTLGVTGENLWLWSRYNGFDPDVSTENETSALRRVDTGAYPRARQIVFNLNIKI